MEEKKLTRQQQRAFDRINVEINKTASNLVERFYNFFMEHDPNSDEVADFQRELSAKWKMYCKRMALKPEALNAINEQCDKIRAEYAETLKAG